MSAAHGLACACGACGAAARSGCSRALRSRHGRLAAPRPPAGEREATPGPHASLQRTWQPRMSAAQWRRAMNSGASARCARCPVPPARPTSTRRSRGTPSRQRPGLAGKPHARPSPRATCSCCSSCCVFPFVATPFITFQVAAQSLVLGLIALSLTFLGGYGGMVSLAQMTVAGIAGYAVAMLGTSSATEISLGWPWWLAVPVALLVCACSPPR